MPPTKDQEKILQDLARQYELTNDRKKTLTSQATSLMGFAGIINTILIAVLVGLATSKDVSSFLGGSPYYDSIVVSITVGFISYIVTLIFALFAYWDPMWARAPRLPQIAGKDTVDTIKHFWANATQYNLELQALQFGNAIDSNISINNEKFNRLRIAFVMLLIGIGAATIGGFLLLLAVI